MKNPERLENKRTYQNEMDCSQFDRSKTVPYCGHVKGMYGVVVNAIFGICSGLGHSYGTNICSGAGFSYGSCSGFGPG